MFEPITNCSLVRYAQICRELVRVENGSAATVASILSRHGLTHDEWAGVHRGWSDRIRASEEVRSAFRTLYALGAVPD